MKRALAVIFVVALAVPLWSEEAKKEKTQPAKTDTQAASSSTTSSQPATVDSPFVAAARRANRKGRKPANVITNETVRQSGGKGHITTTASQYAVEIPEVEPTAEMQARVVEAEAKKQAAEKAAAARKKEEAQQQQRNQAAATEDEDLFNGENPEEIEPAEAGSQNEQKPPQR